MNTSIFEFLAARRSVKPDRLAAPGPTPEQLQQILTVGARVPDHKKLTPWRFIVFEGDARKSMGEVFAKACETEESQPPSHVRLELERGRFLRAPLVVAVVSSIKPRPGAPEWEQILSAAAVCFNTCLAANALGFGTSWITEWIAYSKTVREALGLKESERIAGFIYMGQPMEKPDERERPIVDALITEWPA
ncbi:nitroreductase family protein [Hyphomicrobium denitrificans]|nr:nitroreductase [Hyphomicrobium denitrificans]